MPKCPFICNSDGTAQYCIATDCMFWDSSSNDCLIKLGMTSIMVNLENIKSITERSKLVIEHVHLEHEHLIPHHHTSSDEEFTKNCGSQSMPISSPVSLLIQELLSGVDLDGNSKVFGIDFTIQPLPKLVEGLVGMIRTNIPSMTMDEYLEEINWPGS